MAVILIALISKNLNYPLHPLLLNVDECDWTGPRERTRRLTSQSSLLFVLLRSNYDHTQQDSALDRLKLLRISKSDVEIGERIAATHLADVYKGTLTKRADTSQKAVIPVAIKMIRIPPRESRELHILTLVSTPSGECTFSLFLRVVNTALSDRNVSRSSK